jgi:predicted ribosome quality control (RQC) complex YloA/Tae2 family protein
MWKMLVFTLFSSTTFSYRSFHRIGRPHFLLSRSFSVVQDFKESVGDPKVDTGNMKNVGLNWNIQGLKKEVSRQYLRSVKKMEKVNARLLEKNLLTSAPVVEEKSSEERLSEDGECTLLKEKIRKLRQLEDELSSVRTLNDTAFIRLIPVLRELSITDRVPQVTERGSEKEKNIASSSRLKKPYRVFRSIDNIDIFVGKTAEENDELSCNPLHRHNNEWWLHVHGCPGSHVVIKCTDDLLPSLYKETLKDAAVLAARYSKANPSGKILIHYTRCRNVSKPRNVAAGLVHLSGEIREISVNLRNEVSRYERLQIPDR